MLLDKIADSLGALFDGTFETKGEVSGHELVVRIQSDEMQLYLDGKSVAKAKCQALPRGSVPVLRTSVKIDGKPFPVAVYGRSVLWGSPKIKVCTTAGRLFGDDF